MFYFLDCLTAGAHWNPENVTHGFLNSRIRLHGNLGNVLTVDGRISMVFDILDLSFIGVNSVLNRSIELHERLWWSRYRSNL